MKYDLSKDLIEGLRESTNGETIENIDDSVQTLVCAVVTDMASKSSFINVDRVVFQPVNELYTKAFCSSSEYTYFLGIPNVEMELNSLDKKHYFKNFWKRIKRAWKATRKKKKRKKKEEVQEVKPQSNIVKYNIDDFRRDFISALSNNLTETSIIYDYESYISIIGSEDLGANVKVNIYPCIYDDKLEIFKLYNHKKNKFFEVELNQRFKTLEKKASKCENFVNLIKVYNSVFNKAYSYVPNQILIESLVASCPDNLFEHDLYQTFLNVSNYIRMTDVSSIRSIANIEKSIFEDKLITERNSQVDFQRLVKLLDRYKV